MNSRERAMAAIHRAEPDRIPFDLGGMAQSGIHRLAYAALRRHLFHLVRNLLTRLDELAHRPERLDAYGGDEPVPLVRCRG